MTRTLCMHYLDDFLFADRTNFWDCASLLQHFMVVMAELGVSLVGDKTEGPTTKLTFLGTEFDATAASGHVYKSEG